MKNLTIGIGRALAFPHRPDEYIPKCSIVEMLIPDEAILKRITGERIPGVTTDKDSCIFRSTCTVGGKKQEFSVTTADETWESAKEKYQDWNLEISGGPLACIETVHLLFNVKEPYKIGDMKENARNPWTYNLWDPVRERIIEVGEAVFEKVHGYNLSNYLEMPHKELQKIGYTNDSKAAGIRVPNWSVIRSDTIGKDREIILEGTDSPFTEGIEYFLINGGENVYNPKKRTVKFSGLKGPGTQVAGALGHGRTQLVKEVENKIQIYPIDGGESFLNRIEDKISHADVYSNVQILGQGFIRAGNVRQVALIDVKFY